MADKRSPVFTGQAAAEAFSRVLAAERLADEAVEACRAQAAQRLAAARAKEQPLLERVDARAAAWRARLARAAGEVVAELDRQAERCAEPAGLDAAAHERLVRAAARLADELSGGD